MLVYLCGSTAHSSDHDTAWREAIRPFLRQLGHRVYDPLLDDRKILNDIEIRDLENWKSTDLPRYLKTIRKVIDNDLNRIEVRCDYLIAYWDEHASRDERMQGELTLAHRRAVPVYLVSGVPVEQVSAWDLGCATKVFSDFEQLKRFLNAKFMKVPQCEFAELEPIEQ